MPTQEPNTPSDPAVAELAARNAEANLAAHAKHAADDPAAAPGAKAEPQEASLRAPVTRRRFLYVCGALVLAAGAGLGYAQLVEPHWIHWRRLPLAIENLPESLVGKTMMHLSDLHIGPIVDADYLKRALAACAEHKPDLIILTGDFVQAYGKRYTGSLQEVMRHLPRAPLGTYAVLGNHDYSDYWRVLGVADTVAAQLRELDIAVLRNEVAEVAGGLQIAGMDDYWSPRFEGEKTLAKLDRRRASIVLCHNPDACDRDIWRGYHGWTFSGHTHGGQVRIPLYGPPLLPVRNRRYTQGVFALPEGRRLYINPGLGYLQKVRFNVRPEITLFRLRRENQGL